MFALVEFVEEPADGRFGFAVYDEHLRFRVAGVAPGFSKRDTASEHVAIRFAYVLTDFVAQLGSDSEFDMDQETVVEVRVLVRDAAVLVEVEVQAVRIHCFVEANPFFVIAAHAVGVFENEMFDAEVQCEVDHLFEDFAVAFACGFDHGEAVDDLEVVSFGVLSGAGCLLIEGDAVGLDFVGNTVVCEGWGEVGGLGGFQVR